jgi:glucose-1-phosphate thymidylyltransferase
MKGILMAGGSGSRLRPMTLAVNKHLLAVHDWPMIFYPLSAMMQAGVRDIALITSAQDAPAFQRLLGEGSGLGLRLTLLIQDRPAGIAQAYSLAEPMLAGQPSMLMLGDNLLWGPTWLNRLREAMATPEGATLFCVHRNQPQRFAVLETDAQGNALRLHEKPLRTDSTLAVCGLYLCDGRAASMANLLQPSARGELEMTDLLNEYQSKGSLRWTLLGPENYWDDAGTLESLKRCNAAAAQAAAQSPSPLYSPHEVALRQGWIGPQTLRLQAALMTESPYALHLLELARKGSH